MAAPIHAGDYRHRISIRKWIDTPDGRGGFTRTAKVPICLRTPAFVEPLGGHSLLVAQQIDKRSRYTVSLRWRPDVVQGQALTYHARTGDQELEILQAQDTEERHHELVLTCGEAIA